MRYRAEIDGLRAVAVVPVILFHAGFSLFSGGFVGVDIFFVISGYLITTIILNELDGGKFSIVNFYERRARRILPALFIVLLACLPFAWLWLLPSDMLSFSKSLMSISGFVSNLFFWSERGYFGTATELKPLIHTWSLAIEEQYYVLFPLLLMFLFGKKNRTLIVLLSVAGAGSLAFCIWLTNVHVDSAFYLLPTRFWELLIGSFVAINATFYKELLSGHKSLRSALEVVGLMLIGYSLFFFDEKTSFPGYAALAPTIGAALIILCSTSESVVGRFLSSRLLVGIGLLSYSAYLWHQPVFAFARQYAFSPPSTAVFGGLIVLSFALAYLSWKFVETPFRDKTVWSRKGIFIFSACGLVFFAVVGAAGWQSEGAIARYAPVDRALLQSFVGGGTYTGARFDSLKLAAFDKASPKKKILVIGDSFGKDLVNAVAESGLANQIQISTYQINSECGNLYLSEDFIAHIEEVKRARCKVLGWYENPHLRRLLEEADAVWLASSWLDWVAELLPRSVANLEATFRKPVLVFGTKSFGKINQRQLLSLPLAQRIAYQSEIESNHLKVMAMMRQNLSVDNYVDISTLFCGSGNQCKVVFNDGRLISYDGAHLTKAGATYLGRQLEKNQTVLAILTRH